MTGFFLSLQHEKKFQTRNNALSTASGDGLVRRQPRKLQHHHGGMDRHLVLRPADVLHIGEKRTPLTCDNLQNKRVCDKPHDRCLGKSHRLVRRTLWKRLQ